MNDSKNSSKGLLVLRYPEGLTLAQAEALSGMISPVAKELGVEPLVLPAGADAHLDYGSSALLERVCVALEKIAAQGEPPEVSEAQIAPQALNARPSGLNSRDGASLHTKSFTDGGYTGDSWPLPGAIERMRPTGLKAKPVCRGSWALGTACGHCWRCVESRPNG